MAISTQDGVLAWRRAANYLQGINPAAARQLKALKEYIVGPLGNPDLEFVPFDKVSDTDVVIANGAADLIALVLVKDSTTSTFFKLTDHNTTASDAASEVRIEANKVGVSIAVFPQRLSFTVGITAQGTTTSNGGTGSDTNGASGFALLADS